MAGPSSANHILITNYLIDSQNNFAADHTETKGIPTAGAVFDEVDPDHPAATAGANAKITYPFAGVTRPQELFVSDTVAELVAKSNGTVLASA